MKKLQSNFTTPEQSKRLLELGVPADSADCYYHSLNKIIQKLGKFDLLIIGCDTTISSLKEIADEEGLTLIPCWSVGRLIEIYEICTQTKFNRKQQTDDLVYLSPLEDVLMQIEHNACRFFDNTKWDTNLLNK